MSIASGPGKICVKCSVDVGDKPRMKDSKGRYYCKPCYERVATAKTSAAGPPIQASAESNLLSQLIAAASPPEQTQQCSNCGFSRPVTAALCTHCGFNTELGRVLKPKVIKAKKPRQAGGTIWPIIVGVLSIIFGAGGALAYGFFLVAVVFSLTKADFKSGISALGSTGLMTSLALWLLRDGIRVLRRDSDAIPSLRKWASAKILVYGICLGIYIAIPNRVFEDVMERQSREAPADVPTIKTYMLLTLMWFLAWPTFILVWFFIPRIQDDVEAW